MSPSIEENAWQRAASFAARFHGSQMRKDGKTPYIAHPYRVAMMVRHFFGIDDETVLVAALLHDVIEDTTADFDDLLAEFGDEVAGIVAVLSKDKRKVEPERETEYLQQLAKASWKAKIIKLADAYDNVCDSRTDEMAAKAVGKARLVVDACRRQRELAGAVEHLEELFRFSDVD